MYGTARVRWASGTSEKGRWRGVEPHIRWRYDDPFGTNTAGPMMTPSPGPAYEIVQYRAVSASFVQHREPLKINDLRPQGKATRHKP